MLMALYFEHYISSHTHLYINIHQTSDDQNTKEIFCGLKF